MEIVERDGKQYIKTVTEIDYGKGGVTRIITYDPCITEEARQRRLEAIEAVCQRIAQRL